MDYEKLSDDRLGESSANVQTRVEAARKIQRQRFNQGSPTDFDSKSDLTWNSDMHPAEVRKYCQLDDTSQALMHSAMNQMQLSARAYHRVLKLARTIVDLARERGFHGHASEGSVAIPLARRRDVSSPPLHPKRPAPHRASLAPTYNQRGWDEGSLCI